jgi:diguanylate cyclase (GGDEF)-like protein
MLPATLISTHDLALLLEQALALPLADERLPDFAARIAALAEAGDDREAAFQAAWLLGQHLGAVQDFTAVLSTLEPLLADPLLAAERRADVLLALTEACNAMGEISKILLYGKEALEYHRDRALAESGQRESGEPESGQRESGQPESSELNREHLKKQAHFHEYLGSSFASLRSYHEALEHHMQSLALYEQLEDAEGVGATYNSIGWVYCMMNEHQKAIRFLMLALNIAHERQDAFLEARTLGNLGNVHGLIPDHAAALDFHAQATQIYENIGHLHWAMIGFGNIGAAHAGLGESDQALVWFRRAMSQLEETQNRSYEAWVCVQMAQLMLVSDSPQAKQLLERGLVCSEESGTTEDTAQMHLLLCNLNAQQGNMVVALEHHRAYATLEIKQLQDLNEKRTQALTVQFEVARLEQERQIDRLKNIELVRANEQLEELSLRDALTGLHNRRHLDAQLAKLHLEAQGLGTGGSETNGPETDRLETRGMAQPFAVLVSDIDDFKRVNDSFSHLIGDQVLKTVAQLLVDQVRALDLVVRYGGEEFVLVLTQVTLEQALIIAEKLRATVESYPWHKLHPDLRITLSIGVCADTTLEHHERMLAVADDKMYVAKRNGKNQVQA